MLLTLGSPDPYGYPECLAPQTHRALKRKEFLIALTFLWAFNSSTSSSSPHPAPTASTHQNFTFPLPYFQNCAHEERIVTRHRDMFIETHHKQSSFAQTHGVAYQNKTGSFAICQGQWRSGPHFETQKTATAKSEHTSKHKNAHTELAQSNHVF